MYIYIYTYECNCIIQLLVPCNYGKSSINRDSFRCFRDGPTVGLRTWGGYILYAYARYGI